MNLMYEDLARAQSRERLRQAQLDRQAHHLAASQRLARRAQRAARRAERTAQAVKLHLARVN